MFHGDEEETSDISRGPDICHLLGLQIRSWLEAAITQVIQVLQADNYFPAKSAERRGRSCAGPQTMFDIFLKEVGTLFKGRHKTGPCEVSVTCGT